MTYSSKSARQGATSVNHAVSKVLVFSTAISFLALALISAIL